MFSQKIENLWIEMEIEVVVWFCAFIFSSFLFHLNEVKTEEVFHNPNRNGIHYIYAVSCRCSFSPLYFFFSL